MKTFKAYLEDYYNEAKEMVEFESGVIRVEFQDNGKKCLFSFEFDILDNDNDFGLFCSNNESFNIDKDGKNIEASIDNNEDVNIKELITKYKSRINTAVNNFLDKECSKLKDRIRED